MVSVLQTVLALTMSVMLQSAPPTRVAVVNIGKVSELYDRTADLEAEFNTKREALNKQRDALRDKLERLARALQEEFKPGTEEYLARQKEGVLLEAELKYFMESRGKQIEAELASSLRMIYDDIHTVVAEIATERGFDIVLASDELPPGAPPSTAQMRQQIVLQKVVFWRAELDITNAVVERANERYQKKKNP